MCFEKLGGGGWWVGGGVDLDYSVSSLPNFLFSFFVFRFRRELDNKRFKNQKL